MHGLKRTFFGSAVVGDGGCSITDSVMGLCQLFVQMLTSSIFYEVILTRISTLVAVLRVL
jgi:hypothetical protein